MTLLGAETISIEIGGETFELRPSLRAITRLVHKHGLVALLAAVHAFDTVVIADMLREAAIKPAMLLEEIAAIGLGRVYKGLAGPLESFVFAMAGCDPDADNTPPAPSAESLTPTQVHTRLFEIGTGWLGWSPAQAWAATPTEIIAARRGHLELLQAIHGTADSQAEASTNYSAERLAEIDELGMDPEFDRAGLHALKGKMTV